jgi:2-phosphoglycerate kinase
MMNQFYSKRVPLLILISGTLSIGKSTIATKLSERMNISNVLQTKIISDVMASLDHDYRFKPFWIDENIVTDEELIKSFEKECKIIRKGVNYDIQKCMTEGKALIIEGHHVIPKLYISKSKEETEFKLFTPKPDGEIKEKERERVVREEMGKLSHKGIIIPFLLVSNEKNQNYCVKNGIFFEGENVSYNENDEKSRIRLQIFLNKFRTIQDYLLKNCEEFVIKEINLDNSSQLIVRQFLI